MRLLILICAIAVPIIVLALIIVVRMYHRNHPSHPGTMIKMADGINISIDEWKELHVESFPYSQVKLLRDYAWDWDEVAQCGYNTEIRRRVTETCPKCGEHLIEVYVYTPEESWRGLYGRGGVLTFCPHCHEQIRFELMCMS